jgi:hypothetical protein
VYPVSYERGQSVIATPLKSGGSNPRHWGWRLLRADALAMKGRGPRISEWLRARHPEC